MTCSLRGHNGPQGLRQEVPAAPVLQAQSWGEALNEPGGTALQVPKGATSHSVYIASGLQGDEAAAVLLHDPSAAGAGVAQQTMQSIPLLLDSGNGHRRGARRREGEPCRQIPPVASLLISAAAMSRPSPTPPLPMLRRAQGTAVCGAGGQERRA